MAYRKTGTRDPSGTLQKKENRDPRPYWEPSGTLEKPENRDPSRTLQKTGKPAPGTLLGPYKKSENREPGP